MKPRKPFGRIRFVHFFLAPNKQIQVKCHIIGGPAKNAGSQREDDQNNHHHVFFVQGPLLTFVIDRYSGLAGPSAYSLGKEFANRITGKLNASENLRGPFHPPMPPTPRKTAK